jgi:type 2 lantibiotic biosynthesis protein LanM
MYRKIIRRRAELLQPEGMLARFARDEIRILPRSGKYYGALLAMSFHPDLLRDAADREEFFDRLWEAVEYESYLARLIPFEKADLLGGEVPLFTTLADSRDAWSSAGQRIEKFFPQSGLEAARQRIAALSEDDLGRQRWLIQAAFATVAKEKKKRAVNLKHVAGWTEASPPSHQRMIDLARAIGERLDHTALRAGGEASWLGVSLIEDRHWEIRPLELDLYNGLPGMALFLAQLGAMTGQAQWTSLAQAAAATLQRYIAEEMEAGEDAFPAIGAYDGLGCLLYTLAHLAALWREPALLQPASDLVALAQERTGEGQERGLAHGVAGCLVGMLALHRIAADPETLSAAKRCGDFLLQAANPALSGVKGWEGSVDQPFAAFWHGPLGTAWALLELDRLSYETRFGHAALAMIDDALASEQGLAERRPPGIALGCLRVLPYIHDAARRARLRERIEAGMQSTLAHSLGRNHSLGYGDLGCLDLLLQLNAFSTNGQWLAGLTSLGTKVIASLQHHGWVTGIPLGVESPGLMAGLAGIGYGLLRMADPQRVPSLLALELPRG